MPLLSKETEVAQCYVYVTGIQRDRFVEFEFSVGDPDLAVEMIMPVSAFEEFCQQHNASVLNEDEFAKVEYERLKWRFGLPGIRE